MTLEALAPQRAETSTSTSTSTSAPLDIQKRLAVAAIAVFGTLTAPSSVPAALQVSSSYTQPSSPGAIYEHASTPLVRDELIELKQRSGLTWDQLAGCFGVARRTLHNWARGEGITVQHEERLRSLSALIRALGPGTPASIRAGLMDTRSGPSILERLGAGADVAEVEADYDSHSGPLPAYVLGIEAFRRGQLAPAPSRRARASDEPVTEITADLARAAGGFEQVARGRKARPRTVSDQGR